MMFILTVYKENACSCGRKIVFFYIHILNCIKKKNKMHTLERKDNLIFTEY